jgi:hypothetical protein
MQGANYRAKTNGKKAAGQVSLVLGAGNQTPVACMDILHKLFVDDAVVVCKMNPVNEYMGSYIRCSPPEYSPLKSPCQGLHMKVQHWWTSSRTWTQPWGSVCATS